jgi:5-methylcytosine-specific restriction protein A
MSGVPTDFGWKLNIRWGIGARQALYHKEGTFYMPLEQFPGALCDANGYILFRNPEEYLTNKYIRRGERVNIPEEISNIPGYHIMRGPESVARGKRSSFVLFKKRKGE